MIRKRKQSCVALLIETQAAKGLADHFNRTRSARIFTTPLVTGEGSSSDAATRSRYGHVNISEREWVMARNAT
ncbi:MAG TPA: hypothetical protein VFA61_09205 [Candidatus Udaeobacter sp.]|nr:hypothetical protein [Candidatus Udaeobacter sp.]